MTSNDPRHLGKGTTKFDRFKSRMPEHYQLISCGDSDSAPLTLQHDKCRSEFKLKYRTLLSRLANKRELCPTCNPYLPGKILLIEGYEYIKREGDMVTAKHGVCGNEFTAKYGLIFSRKYNSKSEICPICNPWDQNQIPLWERKSLLEEYDLISIKRKHVDLKHLTCGKTFTITKTNLNNRNSIYKTTVCLHCNPLTIGPSKGEFELRNFIVSNYSGPLKSNDRSQIHPYELDIFLPDLRLAFEYHGDYHHANPKKFKADDKIRYGSGYKTAAEAWERDKLKQQMCTNINIQLIVIWESSWKENVDLEKSKVLEILRNTQA